MQVQAYTSHRRQQGARSLTKVLAFAMLALHAAQLTVPHVANAVQLVTAGTAGDADAEADDEESSLAGKKTEPQAEAQLLNHGRPRGLPTRAHDRENTHETPARRLHVASVAIPAQAHAGQQHRCAQLVRLII